MRRVVCITGAAKGIGKAIALELAKHNYDVVINYHTSETAALALQKEIQETYQVSCLAIQADVSQEAQVDKMFTQIETQLGPVDVLINNAAIDLSNLFYLKTAEEFREKRVGHKMLEREYGRIVNIASTNGMNTYYPLCLEYDASKAALISLTHNLAFEYAPYVHVNAIAPGFIGTESELDG